MQDIQIKCLTQAEKCNADVKLLPEYTYCELYEHYQNIYLLGKLVPVECVRITNL